MPLKRGLPVIVSEQVRFLSQKIEKQLSEVIVLQAIRESEAFESKYNVFPRDINWANRGGLSSANSHKMSHGIFVSDLSAGTTRP